MPIPKKLEDYCADLTGKLMEGFPASGYIVGEHLMKFTNIRQINLFVVNNLMLDWKTELEKLRSPYFDFESTEVRTALDEFANTLSRHIKIGKEDFSQLLNKSVLQAVSLLLTPYEYYTQLASTAASAGFGQKEFLRIGKYIEHNSYIFKRFNEAAQQSGYDPSLYIKQMEEVFEKASESPEDPQEYFNSLSAILPLDPAILGGDAPLEEKVETSTPVDQQSTAPEEGSTLNDRLKEEEPRKTLADLHQEKKIDDIRSSLNLNQRFMFVQGLFEGDENKFNSIIDTLEKLDSYEEARKFLYEQFKWDEDQEEVEEFLEMLSKRLS